MITITPLNSYSSQVEVILGQTIDWTSLVNHLTIDHKITEWRTVIEVVKNFDCGTLESRGLLVLWHLTSRSLDSDQVVKLILICRKL